MQKPAVSLIIPVYNTKAYLAECLNSVLAQTFVDFELILIDDCSADGSEAICQNYAAADSRVKLYRRSENRGGGAARNFGLELAQGDYVGFVDSDDFVAADYLASLYGAITANNADVAQMGYRTVQDGQEREVHQWASQPFLLAMNAAERVQTPLHPAPWGRLYRREYLRQFHIKFAEVFAADDTLFHFLVLITAPRYLLIPAVMYFYRFRPGSLERGTYPTDVELYFDSLLVSMDELDAYIAKEQIVGGDIQAHAWLRKQFYDIYLNWFQYKNREYGADKIRQTIYAEIAKRNSLPQGLLQCLLDISINNIS